MKKVLVRLFSFLFYLVNKNVNKTSFKKRNVIHSTSVYNSNVGSYNYIGKGVIINHTDIGNYCSIAAYTQIGGMEHDWNSLSTSTFISEPKPFERVIIMDDVWIGAGVYVKSGTIIGKGAVIGAGSVVIKDVDPYTIVVGVPARKIRDRFGPEVISEILDIPFEGDPDYIKEMFGKIKL